MKEQKLYKDDRLGNIMYLRIMFDEKDQPCNANIHLKLAKEKDQRWLGNYLFFDKTLYVKRFSEKHLHRQTNSFGFNNELLKDSYLNIQWIQAIIDGVEYKFPRSLIDQFGQFIQFNQSGFELQRMLKFKLIKKYKTINHQENDNDSDSDQEP